MIEVFLAFDADYHYKKKAKRPLWWSKNLGNLEVTVYISVFGEITVDFFTSHSILVQTAPVEPWCKSDRARWAAQYCASSVSAQLPQHVKRTWLSMTRRALRVTLLLVLPSKLPGIAETCCHQLAVQSVVLRSLRPTGKPTKKLSRRHARTFYL